MFVLTRFVLDPDDRVLVTAAFQMTVNAVVTGIEPAAKIPTAVNVVVITIEDRTPGVEPGQPVRLALPECLGAVGQRLPPRFALRSSNQPLHRRPLVLLVLLSIGREKIPERTHNFGQGGVEAPLIGRTSGAWRS